MLTARPKLVLRGGVGPEQPVWPDVRTYSAEWYRRFRTWHHERYPDADTGTRANVDLLVEFAEQDET